VHPPTRREFITGRLSFERVNFLAGIAKSSRRRNAFPFIGRSFDSDANLTVRAVDATGGPLHSLRSRVACSPSVHRLLLRPVRTVGVSKNPNRKGE
jgi:hypothetical protein